MEHLKDSEFKKDKHIKYFIRCINALPSAYISMDTSRMTVLFFSLSGLDILKSLHKLPHEKEHIINWIYSLQICPSKNSENSSKYGFKGSPFLGNSFNKEGSFSASHTYEGSHVAMTYTALLSLVILNDDLSRLNKDALITGLKSLQLENGSFYSTPEGSENDMRFLYCACCISYILNDWRGLDKSNAVKYIQDSMCYDYGISQGPHLEAHGGSTFCALASLVLMNKLNDCFTPMQIEKLKRWCLVRQKNGFQGRPNKPVDTCYSFWVGASLKLLDSYHMIDIEENHTFILSTQHPIIGGFSKWPDIHSDVLHTYFGLCGLSLMNLYDLENIHPALNVSAKAHKHLVDLHKNWQSS
ncbi:geranylgeranyl transferase type-1 subunit beta-like [Hydractinia symbiolongicarpus]|uniref:geranylgeranyl transferase type-1 subunit beta-like n=1 Tax=Hydractinia symbiolongicarpus TaxID=13093 RepID=UPI00255024DA|nr:geranylgeranyl transferase type-1 subunit beta-like [Hydractinia symbiolongicarpus]